MCSECCYSELSIPIRDGLVLTPGCKIRIGRFESKLWSVKFGWYSYGGNRPVCGWYLESDDDEADIRPLQKPDLTDIYLIKL